jgi:uncharacterized membrane protein YdfJ with MMPL/SSD domain
VIYSAMTTATAFGSLWMSSHPGTSSMGKLMALSLLCTMAAAVLFQPALMGPPRGEKGLTLADDPVPRLKSDVAVSGISREQVTWRRTTTRKPLSRIVIDALVKRNQCVAQDLLRYRGNQGG